MGGEDPELQMGEGRPPAPPCRILAPGTGTEKGVLLEAATCVIGHVATENENNIEIK